MVSRDDVLELVPHYVAMALLVFFVAGIVRIVVDEPHLLVDVIIVFTIVFGYPLVVKRLDVVSTPSQWERNETDETPEMSDDRQ